MRSRAGLHGFDPRTVSRNYKEAIENLNKLDLIMAINLGIVDAAALDEPFNKALPFARGITQFLDNRSRPRVLGGVTEKTVKRYRAVFDRGCHSLNGADCPRGTKFS